jgi:hypothetical protein
VVIGAGYNLNGCIVTISKTIADKTVFWTIICQCRSDRDLVDAAFETRPARSTATDYNTKRCANCM